DLSYIRRALELALLAEREGNLPIGAVIVLDGGVIAEAGSRLIIPDYHPGRHAEMDALRLIPVELWPRSSEMICYTTLQPCVMCFGALLLHGVGRIVFGARDREGGASALLNSLPSYYADGTGVPTLEGPVLPEECDELYERTAAVFDHLPCGRLSQQKR